MIEREDLAALSRKVQYKSKQFVKCLKKTHKKFVAACNKLNTNITSSFSNFIINYVSNRELKKAYKKQPQLQPLSETLQPNFKILNEMKKTNPEAYQQFLQDGLDFIQSNHTNFSIDELDSSDSFEK